MKISFAAAVLVSLVKANGIVWTIEGGAVMDTFQTCESHSCNFNARCCNMKGDYHAFERSLCMSNGYTQGYSKGIYIDNVNWPNPKYEWDCTMSPSMNTDGDGDADE